MRSRPARLTLSALAWIALGAAAFFTVHLQQQIDHRQAALRTFEASARDAADALGDAQSAQQAYVAVGQEAAEWIPKVSTYLQTATATVESLRSSALSQGAGPALLEASAALTQVGNVDRQVRERIAVQDERSAADAIFADGADAFAGAVTNVDLAVAAEQQAADAFEVGRRRLQIYISGAGLGFAALILALFGLLRTTRRSEDQGESDEAGDGLSLHDARPASPAMPAPVPVTVETSRPALSADALKTLAGVCTKFGRVRDAAELKPLLAEAAGVLNARGIIVWLGSSAGADLRPVLAYGYSDHTLAKIPTLARSADNAAATAYRTADLQIVPSRPGGQQGTVVAPLLAVTGCIGAVTAEIRDGGEQSEFAPAITQLLAAQLAGLLAAAADAPAAAATDTHAAAG